MSIRTKITTTSADKIRGRNTRPPLETTELRLCRYIYIGKEEQTANKQLHWPQRMITNVAAYKP